MSTRMAALTSDDGSREVGRRPVTGGLGVPRRRRPSLGVLAAVLVVLGGLAGLSFTGTNDGQQQVLAVGRVVPVGHQVNETDLAVTELTAGNRLDPIPADQMDTVVGKTAAVELRPGTLLTTDQLTNRQPPGAGEELVGLVVERGRMPSEGVSAGSRVRVVESASDQAIVGQDPAVPLGSGAEATVIRVGEADDNGARVVDVLVPEETGTQLAELAGTGRLALVLLPAGR